MTWKALVPPRLWVTARPGWCLQYAQSVFNAPVMHETAWIAWQNQQFRHGPSEPLPDVPVLLWFSHWATYNGVYMNWGHVAVLVPGDAIYSSPSTPLGSPPSFERYGTIQEVEQRFSSTYVGWSEDINTLRVAAYDPSNVDPEPIVESEEIMAVYLEASNNSSPTKAGDPGSSRIWAGERVINGAKYAGVWERSEDGSIRRLFAAEWAGIQAAYASVGREAPLSKVHGNAIEQIYLVTRSAPKQ